MSSAPFPFLPDAAAYAAGDFRRALVRVVDAVPETRGLGVVLIEWDRLHRLRMPDPGEATVIFELRERPRGIPFIEQPPQPVWTGQMAAHSPALPPTRARARLKHSALPLVRPLPSGRTLG